MDEAKQKRAAMGKSSAIATRKKAACRGAVKLKKAASETLEENSEKIAKSLLDRTLAGNVRVARLLLELAEGSAENMHAGKKQHIRSMAIALAKEPQWPPEAMETAGDNR